MTPSPQTLRAEVVLIGGGHTHALVLRRWAMDPMPGVRLTLINPGPSAPYTGMLPGHIAGHYPREALQIDLIRLARFAVARVVLDRAISIDRAARRIVLAGGRTIAFDVASINVGITSGPDDVPGFQRFGTGAKPLDRFADTWAALDQSQPIAVLGGGVGGVELAMAMAHARGTGAGLTVIERAEILNAHPMRQALMARMATMGITVLEQAQAVRINADAVALADGRSVPSGFTVGAAGALVPGWLAETGLDRHGDGSLRVGPTLQTSDPTIFAAGDCAHMDHAPRPKTGVFAVRQAPVLHDNLRAAATARPMKTYRPQKNYLKLVLLGDRQALAAKWGRTVQGPWVWRWKDRIDRRFMDRLNHPPLMSDPNDPMLCTGCGAKVAAGALAQALSGLGGAKRDDVTNLPGDDAAVLRVGGARQVISTDHLSAVTDDPHVMARIAAVHALGDIWAMGATPQAALASLILPRMVPAMQADWLAEIMGAASEVFAEAGAAVAGGHSSLGDSLTIGFTVTGLLEGDPITLAGAKPGDVLILTKPIGTGVLLAGGMRGVARGADVAAALASMAHPQGDAAAALRDAHAMTDVTGFGLAGHLMNICRASDVAATLTLDAIPLLNGAAEMAEDGVRSTLWPDNAVIADQMALPNDPRADLLFDPQTAGGLLAAVAPDQADAVLQALGDEGHQIGKIVEGAPFVTVR